MSLGRTLLSRVAAFLLVLGIILWPLRAVATTIAVLVAHDTAVSRTAAVRDEPGPLLRPERGDATEYIYDAAHVGYDGAANPQVVHRVGAGHAYDPALDPTQRHAAAEGAVDAATTATTTTATTAAEGAEAVGFRSFPAFKRAMGPAGEGMQWHHIVEQTPGNVAKFGAEAVHNTANLVRLETRFHRQVSGLYSSIRPDITGSTSLKVRQWLSTQSFEAQASFGRRVIENISSGVWP